MHPDTNIKNDIYTTYTWFSVRCHGVSCTLYFLLLAVFSGDVTASHAADLCSLIPVNPKVYTNENITFNCTSPRDARNLEFNINNDRVPEDQVRILDNHTASISIVNVNMSFNLALIMCKEKNITNKGCEDIQMLNVFEPPLPVLNVTCVVHDWTSTMNCSWNLGKNYTRNTTVALKWRVSGYQCEWTPCASQSPGYCVWNSTLTDGDFTMKSIDMAITVTSGVSPVTRRNTSYYKINTGNIVKPNPVTNLQSHPVNSSCVSVSWRPARKEYNKTYNLCYLSKWNSSQVCNYIQETHLNKFGDIEITYCNLIPHTTYHFIVTVKPSDGCQSCFYGNCTDPEEVNFQCLAGTGYWSYGRTTAVATYGDVPGKAPDMTEGGYMWRPLEQNYRRVYIYWKALDDIYTNSPLIGYDVTISSVSDNPNKPTEHSLANYVTFDDIIMRSDEAYNVTVTARNANGTSQGSTIHIPPHMLVLSPPAIIVKMSNESDTKGLTEVDVTWYDFSVMPNVMGFTLFTCRNDGGNCAYQSSIQWSYVPRTNLSTTFKMVSPQQYIYGLSGETNQGSSGFHWQSCVYTKGADLYTIHAGQRPIKIPHLRLTENRMIENPSSTLCSLTEAPGNLQVHAGTGGSSLFVSWDFLRSCESGGPYVDMYRLEYCEGLNLTDSCKVTNVSSKESSVVLQGLKEEQLYSIGIQGVTASGQPGPWSKHVQTTTEKDAKKAMLAGIIAGVLCGVIIILCFIWRCYKKIKDRCKTPAIVDILKETQVPNKQHEVPSSSKTSSSEERLQVNIIQTSTNDQNYIPVVDQNQNRSDSVGMNYISLQTFPVGATACDRTCLNLDQNLNSSDQTLNPLDQCMSCSDQSVNGSDQNINSSDQNLNYSDQKLICSAQILNCSDHNMNSSDQSMNSLDQNINSSDQNQSRNVTVNQDNSEKALPKNTKTGSEKVLDMDKKDAQAGEVSLSDILGHCLQSGESSDTDDGAGADYIRVSTADENGYVRCSKF